MSKVIDIESVPAKKAILKQEKAIEKRKKNKKIFT